MTLEEQGKLPLIDHIYNIITEPAALIERNSLKILKSTAAFDKLFQVGKRCSRKIFTSDDIREINEDRRHDFTLSSSLHDHSRSKLTSDREMTFAHNKSK